MMKPFLLLICIVMSLPTLAQLSDYPVVFIHGIAHRYEDWRPMAERMTRDNIYTAGFDSEGNIETDAPAAITSTGSIWLLSYYQPKPIDESLYGDLTLYSERLGQLVELVKHKTGSEKVVIIAHSMGGLVSRFYMSRAPSHWQSVHRILTVGTPHQGVYQSVPIVGQLQDLATNSKFIEQLDKQWSNFPEANLKWGVVGGVSFINGLIAVNGLSSDFAGPGFVSLYSSIPYGEWKQALKQPGQAQLNTEHFGYRLLLQSGHRELLKHPKVESAILWSRQL